MKAASETSVERILAKEHVQTFEEKYSNRLSGSALWLVHSNCTKFFADNERMTESVYDGNIPALSLQGLG